MKPKRNLRAWQILKLACRRLVTADNEHIVTSTVTYIEDGP